MTSFGRMCVLALLLIPFGSVPATGQDGYTKELEKLQAQLREATEDYKKSLGELLALREKDLANRKEELRKIELLAKEGYLQSRDVEKARSEVTTTEGRAAEVRQRIEAADKMLAEALAEPAEIEKKLARQPKKRERTPTGRVYYVRYIIIGEIAIYDYSGAVRGHVIKQGQRIRYDSRRPKR